jgi:hypothetical protein
VPQKDRRYESNSSDKATLDNTRLVIVLGKMGAIPFRLSTYTPERFKVSIFVPSSHTFVLSKPRVDNAMSSANILVRKSLGKRDT